MNLFYIMIFIRMLLTTFVRKLIKKLKKKYLLYKSKENVKKMMSNIILYLSIKIILF